MHCQTANKKQLFSYLIGSNESYMIIIAPCSFIHFAAKCMFSMIDCISF